MVLIYCFTFYNISVADAVVSETEEFRGNTQVVVSDTLAAQQVSELSSKQGEDLKTLLLNRTNFSFADY